MRVIGEGLERVYARTDELALINIRRRLAAAGTYAKLTRKGSEQLSRSSILLKALASPRGFEPLLPP